MIKGMVIGGSFNNVIIREKAGAGLEIGELLTADIDHGKVLLQVHDLNYSSQISQQNLELVSGMSLEENADAEFMDANIRNYRIAFLKNLLTIKDDKHSLCKELPNFFSNIRSIEKTDLGFISVPKTPLYIGKLRSGSKTIDVDIVLNGEDVLSHHILIPAMTGKGKSNLTSIMLWNAADNDYCGILVLDPHDEYYGRNKLGLKDHPSKDKIVYYTSKDAPPGCRTLKINLETIRPHHLNGVVDWSDPQKDCLDMFNKKYGDRWIEAIILEKPVEGKFAEQTVGVVKRKLMNLLDLEWDGAKLSTSGIFELNAGSTTIKDVVKELEESKTAIVDTSNFDSAVEILIGSMIASEIFNKYKHYKRTGELKNKPIISIVLEEAPRVLGRDVLEKGPNIFSTIAREGRKFKIGLVAITQLPSLIPKEILANINTKIILGIEMKSERQAIIESASQDLSDDDRNIASLDKGEALITSNFTKFATPVKIPLFEEIVKEDLGKKGNMKNDFSGVKLE